MKIELTIAVDYLPGWGVFEGVRELLQNARDAQTELSAPMTVRTRASSDSAGVLVIENEGCTMPYEALLLGHTSKADRSDLIGKFGEGFKLGILALLRAGHSVKIRNGSEVWVPSIEQSDRFACRVLTFDIQKGRKNENRVQIEVGNISAEVYRDEIRPRFLWLDAKDGDLRTDCVKTAYGSLLLSSQHKGRVYVKGIFVEHKPELTVGFDFEDCEVDRDRKMVSSYDYQWKARQIWTSALAQRPDLFGQFLTLVEEKSADTAGIDDYYAKKLPEAFVDHAVATFDARYGSDAVPVSNLGESQDLEHFGRKGVVVSDGLRAIIERTRGPLTKVKDDLRTEVTRTYSWHELSSDQKANLTRAVALVNAVCAVSVNDIGVCDFRSTDLHGLFSSEGGIKLAANVIARRGECLATLVHEVAHRAGVDGEKGHVAQIERIWSAIVENLANGS